MRVDPAQGDHIMLYLRFEHLYLVSHEAVVLMALLSGHDEMSDQEVPLFLPASEDSTSLYFNLSV